MEAYGTAGGIHVPIILIAMDAAILHQIILETSKSGARWLSG